LLVALVVSYMVCIAGDLFLGWTMYQVWAPLLPGFAWPLTAAGFIIGLLWLVAYAAWIPLVFVVHYNYLIKRDGFRELPAE
jgi:hypothetical protein